MGITTYLFHKSDGLEKQKYNMFFLDMGENIHFHYRDLRIELSVDEFKELAALFARYSGEVLKEIEAGYKDGVLANTNETGTLKTFWDKEMNLTVPVKYHEHHLAVEETKDGYHLHLRNYKILLHRESFLHLVKAIAPILPLLDGRQLLRDPVLLLKENELATKLVSRLQTEGQEEIVIEVEKTFANKAGQVLKAIGYSTLAEQDGQHQYVKEGSRVTLVSPGCHTVPAVGTYDLSFPLPEFFAQFGAQLDAIQLNQLKLKVISLLKKAAQGQLAPFTLENLSISRQSLNPAVDLFNRQDGILPARELERFNALLGQHKLFFVKPEKEFFSPAEQNQIEDAFFDFVMKKLAPHECVRKIYVLGSSRNHRSGHYQVPFVHFDWAKLNSDFDIYLELDPDCREELPREWEKKFYWPRAGCDYYHFGDLGDGMTSEVASLYPEIHFYEYLVEGYLFQPARGDKAKKDGWFAETKARCIFARDKIAAWVNQHYPLAAQDTEKFNVASFNRVYHILSKPDDYVLKVYDSQYLTPKNREKISYEIGLLDSLKDSGLEIALPVKNSNGDYISQMDQEQAVLFTFVPGRYRTDPSRDETRMAGRLLARFHDQARAYHTHLSATYSNKQLLFYWLKAWKDYHNQGGIVGTDIALDIAYYNKRLRNFNDYPTHCHGDLSVINYLFAKDACWLIDFQSVGFGPALVDLANGMVEFAARKRLFVLDNLEAFREGYQSIRRLTAKEQDYLPDLLITQIACRQAKLLRLHYGGFGYELKEDRILGLRLGLELLL
jgi:Ser/Thr protein kinase RdoA (MazF antagonist)